MGLPEIAVDVRPDMDPRNAGGAVASASVTCPACAEIVTRTVRMRDPGGNPQRAAVLAGIQARRSAEDVVVGSCPRCQLAVSGWTFGAPVAPSLLEVV